MGTTTNRIAKIYLIGGLWLLAMLASALLVHLSMTTLYWAVDASPMVRTLTTMSLALVMATSIARIAWVRLGSRTRTARSSQYMAGQRHSDARDAALVTIR